MRSAVHCVELQDGLEGLAGEMAVWVAGCKAGQGHGCSTTSAGTEVEHLGSAGPPPTQSIPAVLV